MVQLAGAGAARLPMTPKWTQIQELALPSRLLAVRSRDDIGAKTTARCQVAYRFRI